MQRHGIEDESWFEAARTGLERRAFKLRVLPRTIVIDKDGRLPRIVGSAREFLEFAERQGLAIDPADYRAADAYGDDKSDTPFETPIPGGQERRARAPAGSFGQPGAGGASVAVAEAIRPEMRAVEARLAELRLEQDRVLAERRAMLLLVDEKRQVEARCAALEVELARVNTMAAEIGKQRDLYQLSAMAAEDRLRVLQAALEGPPEERGADKKFIALRRFLARELHPDLSGEDAAERVFREAIFKRVWAKIEQLQ